MSKLSERLEGEFLEKRQLFNEHFEAAGYSPHGKPSLNEHQREMIGEVTALENLADITNRFRFNMTIALNIQGMGAPVPTEVTDEMAKSLKEMDIALGAMFTNGGVVEYTTLGSSEADKNSA